MTSEKPKSLSTFEPATFDELMKFAEVVAGSALVPASYRNKETGRAEPADVLVAFAMGAEIGLRPLQALQNIAVINGRPAVWGDAMLAVVAGHPDFVDIDEVVGEDVATCTVRRRGRTDVVRSFSMAQAKTAGLAGKPGPWQTYPRRMLQMRARGYALRDAFPDALRGVISAEEARDLGEVDITDRAEVIRRPSESRADAVARALPPLDRPEPGAPVAAPDVAPPAPAQVAEDPDPELEPAEPAKPPQATDPESIKVALGKVDRAQSIGEVNDALDATRHFSAQARRTVQARAKTRIAEITGAGAR